MIHEFDLVTLKHPIPDHSLSVGLEGTVVDAMHINKGFVTVEFFDGDETVAVLPVRLDDLQPIESEEHNDANDRKPSPSTAPFVYHDGVVYVRSWEWDTRRSSLLGHHVHTRVYPIMELRRQGLECISTPAFALTFDNGWTVAVAMADSQSRKGEDTEAQRANIFISSRRAWNDSPDTEEMPHRSDEDALRIIRDVAERAPEIVERRTHRLPD